MKTTLSRLLRSIVKWFDETELTTLAVSLIDAELSSYSPINPLENE